MVITSFKKSVLKVGSRWHCIHLLQLEKGPRRRTSPWHPKDLGNKTLIIGPFIYSFFICYYVSCQENEAPREQEIPVPRTDQQITKKYLLSECLRARKDEKHLLYSTKLVKVSIHITTLEDNSSISSKVKLHVTQQWSITHNYIPCNIPQMIFCVQIQEYLWPQYA